jgi:hypothetical protein
MNFIVPVSHKNQEEANITLLEEVKYWAYIEMGEGEMSKCEFYDNREDIQDWVECVVVANDKEYVWPFMEENIMVLVAPEQNTIEEIVSAYMFRELHDLNL